MATSTSIPAGAPPRKNGNTCSPTACSTSPLNILQPQATDELFRLWNVACDIFVSRFLAQLKIGQAPPDMVVNVESLPTQNEAALFRHLQTQGAPDAWTPLQYDRPRRRGHGIGATAAQQPLAIRIGIKAHRTGPTSSPAASASG